MPNTVSQVGELSIGMGLLTIMKSGLWGRRAINLRILASRALRAVCRRIRCRFTAEACGAMGKVREGACFRGRRRQPVRWLPRDLGAILSRSLAGRYSGAAFE